MDTVNTKKTYTIQEAAELLEVVPEVVRLYIRKGKLKATKKGRGYLITLQELYNMVNAYDGKAEAN